MLDTFESALSVLSNPNSPLTDKFRAVFTLRTLGGERAINAITNSLIREPSILFKHECAYCLGQMKNEFALSYLYDILADESQAVIVRHEAGEAISAIGNPDSIPIIQLYLNLDNKEIRETCYLALRKLQDIQANSKSNAKKCIKIKNGVKNVPSFSYDGTLISYDTVDPAPSFIQNGEYPGFLDQNHLIEHCRNLLLDDPDSDIYDKYKALFTLRDIATPPCIDILSRTLSDPANRNNRLLNHEIAFIMGQMQEPLTLDCLAERLRDKGEHAMVRHESAEAIGSIIGKIYNETLENKSAQIEPTKKAECLKLYEKYEALLRSFLNDHDPLVKESCVIALDISDYIGNDKQFKMLRENPNS